MSANVFDLQGSISMDVSGFEKALKDVISEGKNLVKSLSENTAQMKELQDSVEKAKAELEHTKKSMQETADTTSDMTKEVNKSADATEDMAKEVSGLKSDLAKAEKAVEDTADETKKLADRMDKAEDETKDLKEQVDKLEDQYDKTEKETKELDDDTKKLGNTVENTEGKFAKLADFLKIGFKTAITVGVGAIAAAGTAIVGYTKTAFDEYSRYQQLYGGVEAAFEGNVEAIQKITEYGKGAWENLTMSQNDYYESFMRAYPLIKSGMEDENAAIETTNRLMQIESDLANTFGYEAETAANAINWAFKGTYSYLDNLNIGLTGTKEGFLENVNASGLFSEQIENLEDLSTDQIISVIEHYAAEVGVIDRTLNEAKGTLEGSSKMFSVAWENLKISIASGDIESINEDINILSQTLEGTLNNALPVIENILNSLGTAIPKIVTQLSPTIIKAGVSVASSLFKAFTNPDTIRKGIQSGRELFKSIFSNAQALVKSASDTLPGLIATLTNELTGNNSVIQSLGNALSSLISGGLDVILNSADGILEFISRMIDDIGVTLETVIPDLLPKVLTAIWTLADKIANSSLFDSIAGLVLPLMDAILTAAEASYPVIFEMIPKVISDLFSTISLYFDENSEQITEQLVNFIVHLIEFARAYTPEFLKVTLEVIAAVAVGLWESIPKIYEPFAKAFEDLGSWLHDVRETIMKKQAEIVEKVYEVVRDFRSKLYDKMLELGEHIVHGIWNGILEAKDWIIRKITGFAGDVTAAFESAFGIHSPSTVMRDLIGTNLALGIEEGFTDKVGMITRNMAEALGSGIDTEFDSNIAVEGSPTRAQAISGGMIVNVYNNFDGANFPTEMSVEDIADVTVEKISEKLEMLDIYNRIAIGGGIA